MRPARQTVFFPRGSAILPEPERERPRAVTVIGRVWLVLGVLYLLRSLLNLISWKLLQMGAPGLLQSIAEDPRYGWLLRPLFRHLSAWFSAEAIASALAAFSAYELLRLRRWARIAMQGVCWAALTYVALFTGLFAWLWPKAAALKAAADPTFSEHSYGRILIAVSAASLALGAGLAVMIALLRGSKVREVFRSAPSPP